jgi:uncharacterized protein DUF4446
MTLSLGIAILGLFCALAAAVAAGVALLRLRRAEQKLAVFLQGKDGKSLEQVLLRQGTMLAKHADGIRELVQASEYLHEATQAAIRKMAFERYSPFPGVGGNQSFTLALLDAHNSGVVITSLHGRESTRVYAKAIRQGKPLQNLSEEEHRVFQQGVQLPGA